MAQLQSYDAVVIDTVASLGASAFMSGVGGDNVFHLTRSARPLVDRLLTVGPTLGALRTLRDICAITGARPLAVIREAARVRRRAGPRSEEHTSELQSLMRISSAVFCLKTPHYQALCLVPSP